MLGRSDATRPAAIATRPARQWWQTWPGQALGAGGFLIGLSVLLFTLRQAGVIGRPMQSEDSTAVLPFQSSPAGVPAGKTGVKFDESRQALEKADQSQQARVADVPPREAAAPSTETVNLLDTDAGAQLLAANQEGWKPLFSGKPTFAFISSDGFAVLALSGDKAVPFDTLAIFVDSTSGDNVKELAIYTSSASPEGPFVKAAQVTVPNHRNMQKPFHELHFAPLQARFVKLQLLSSQRGGPYLLLGSIQLHASNTNGRF